MKLEILFNNFKLRNTEAKDILDIQEMCQRVYPFVGPWKEEQILSHIKHFPEGQIVVEDLDKKKVIGMASSLSIKWDEYEFDSPWKDFTEGGYFTNHDPENGKTLYGAEVMIDPAYQGKKLGKLLYKGRREIVRNLNLLRIRAGARMRGYGTYAKDMSPQEYLLMVIKKKLFDPTISFQLKEGFKVVAHVPNYLAVDPESLGNAVVIEWLNPDVAQEENFANQRKRDIKLFGEEKAKDLYVPWESSKENK
ncbi:MAG: GNAT family N-acetyltransferase [Bdellovibrionota bacterium]